MALAIILFSILLYFLPAVVAHQMNHHNRMAITALNVLGGWTVVGWIVALVWALTSPPPPPQR